MRKILNLFFGLLLTSIISIAQETSTSFPEGAATPERLDKLQELLDAQIEKVGTDVGVEVLSNAVKAEMLKAFPVLAVKGKEYIGEDVTLEVANEKLNATAHKQYPEYTREELVEESEKRYPLYKKNQRVTIHIRTNPKKTEKVTGYFNGFASGNIRIGHTSYRLADMVGISGNDGPDGEIAKFDPNLNRQYRAEWRLEYARTNTVNRQKFIEENKSAFEKAQRIEDFLENEKRGFTYYHDRWLDADELLEEFSYVHVINEKKSLNEKKNLALEERVKEIEAQSQMIAISTNAAPIGALPSAEKELIRREQEEQKRQELKAQRERELERMAEAAAAEAAEAEARRERERERLAREAAAPEVGETQKSYNIYIYIVIGVVVLLILGGWCWNRYRNGEDDLDVSKFYEGKGRVQQEFWDAANADPKNFKYVSYLFPDVATAKNALLQLSYIYSDENGNLQSKKADLRYGFYEHQNGAVAFIGSTGLNYARWREASMIWPDIPRSNYFKVSAEPMVNLTVPDLDKINRSAGLHVTSLGAEDIRTDSGEINRVYRYKASNKEEAIKFLGVFEIEEEGLVVRVDTAEGEYGKDINGVFMV